MTAENMAVAGLMLIAWLAVSLFPKNYIHAMFATVPLMGLYVTVPWEIDPFKCGLFMAPLVLLRVVKPARLDRLLVLCPLLFVYGGLLAAWAITARELSELFGMSSLSLESRLLTQNGLFALRLMLPMLVVSQARSLRDVDGWANTYSWSVTLLAAYGLLQEVTFVALGTPITPIWRDGIFGTNTEIAPISLMGMTLLRVHSLCREPKDLALFCVPAIAWLWARRGLRAAGSVGQRKLEMARLAVIVAAALLTFSSSLLLCLPLVFLAVEASHPLGLMRRKFRYWLKAAPLMAAVLPLFLVASEDRVMKRFANEGSDLQYTSFLQASRERPAVQFLADRWPRSALGFGIGTQAFYLTAYMPEESAQKVAAAGAAAGVDSMLVGLFGDLGVPGAALMAAIMIYALRRRRSKVGNEFWAARAALLSTLIIGVPLNPDQKGVMWLMIGLVCAAKLGSGATRRTELREIEVLVETEVCV